MIWMLADLNPEAANAENFHHALHKRPSLVQPPNIENLPEPGVFAAPDANYGWFESQVIWISGLSDP